MDIDIEWENQKLSNWVRAAKGTEILCEPLQKVVDKGVQRHYSQLMNHFSQGTPVQCNQCTLQNLLPEHAVPNKQCNNTTCIQQNSANCLGKKSAGRRKCPNGKCSKLYDFVVRDHRYKDPNGRIRTQARRIRNEILHRPKFELEDSELQIYLDCFIAVAKDLKADPAVQKLKQLKNNQITISHSEPMHLIQEAKDQCKQEEVGTKDQTENANQSTITVKSGEDPIPNKIDEIAVQARNQETKEWQFVERHTKEVQTDVLAADLDFLKLKTDNIDIDEDDTDQQNNVVKENQQLKRKLKDTEAENLRLSGELEKMKKCAKSENEKIPKEKTKTMFCLSNTDEMDDESLNLENQRKEYIQQTVQSVTDILEQIEELGDLGDHSKRLSRLHTLSGMSTTLWKTLGKMPDLRLPLNRTPAICQDELRMSCLYSKARFARMNYHL